MSFESEVRIRRAIHGLLAKEPFFAHVSLGLRIRETKQGQTMATDGKHMFYNDEFVKGIDDDELTGVVAHETLHAAFLHPYRMKGLNIDKFQVAADIQVNEVLVKRGFKLPCDGGVQDSEKAWDDVNRRYRSVEEIYNLLDDKNFPNLPKVGLVLPGVGDEEDEGGDGNPEDEREARKRAYMAASEARLAGKMPAELEAVLETLGRGERDWRDSFRRYLGGGNMREYTWSRPNRRFIGQGDYLPGMGRFGPGEIVLAIDSSGSIDEPLLNKFIAEVRKVNEDVQPEKIHVVVCDARVQWTQAFGPYDDVYAEPKGRGGTAFSPVFKWIREMGISPKAVIYFTDLECSDFGQDPGCPVMWIVWPGGSSRSVPFGEVVRM